MESQQKKKRNFLIGFGAAAVVLVAVLATWPPAFLNEDATGSIGAVQKHRAPQITAKDVVLVDEATRKEETILYGDYLTDAAKLESISAGINAVLRNRTDNLQAKEVGSKDTLESVRQDLQSHQAELQLRYESRMSEALGAASQFLARDSASLNSRELASVKQDIDSLASKLASHTQLASAAMANLNSSFANISAKLEAHSQAVRNLENAERGLASVSSLASKAELASADQLNAAAALENVSSALGSLAATPCCSISLQSRSAALESIALESQSLAAVPTAIESFSQGQLGSQAGSAALENAARDLAALGSKLESRALDNMSSRLEAQNQIASHLQSMQSSLESAKHDLESHNVSLDNQFASALSGAIRDLQARSSELQSKMASSAQMQLGLISSHLESLSQLNLRLESASQLGSRNADALQASAASSELGSKMASRDQLNSKLAARDSLGSQLQNRDELGLRLQSHLSSLTRSIESHSSDAGLQVRQEQALQAQSLASKVAELQSHNQ